MLEKLYLSAQGLLEDAFKLGAMVIASGFEPSFILTIWRGGTPVGIAVHEFVEYHGLSCDHIAIRASSYSGIDGRAPVVRIDGMSYLVRHLDRQDRLLIVDDVFDTGHTIEAVIGCLRERARLNCPEDVKVAAPYYKPARNQSDRTPDYYLHETDAWIKFPHSLEGLSEEEIRANRPALFAILQGAKKTAQ